MARYLGAPSGGPWGGGTGNHPENFLPLEPPGGMSLHPSTVLHNTAQYFRVLYGTVQCSIVQYSTYAYTYTYTYTYTYINLYMFGLTRSRLGKWHVSKLSLKYPDVTRIINQWICVQYSAVQYSTVHMHIHIHI